MAISAVTGTVVPRSRRTLRVLRRRTKAAPVALDLRTPSGRRLPW